MSIDSYLIDYIRSGEAVLLVGSGPSSEMGYPSWGDLAYKVVSFCEQEEPEAKMRPIRSVFKNGKFPSVFSEAEKIIGGKKLIEFLRGNLQPQKAGKVYDIISRWPVPIYLTTNYDDEIHNYLARLGESYITYSNSEEHIEFLSCDQGGIILKLHGDLTSQNGLILTKESYDQIDSGTEWQYWRTKMVSMFQMCKVVIIGHSLTDENIKHILSAANSGAGINKPVCWIAPDVSSSSLRRKYLEENRIRVISYQNKDGSHRNLVRLLETINNFIPPRSSVRMPEARKQAIFPSNSEGQGAHGFFVFNKMIQIGGIEDKQLDVLLASFESKIDNLSKLAGFSIHKALLTIGWPSDVTPDKSLLKALEERAVSSGLFEKVDTLFTVSKSAKEKVKKELQEFNHSKKRFIQSVKLNIQKKYPSLSGAESEKIAKDVEKSLIQYFDKGGLTLATTLFSSKNQIRRTILPQSVISFINEASTVYDNYSWRQIFVEVSLDSFVRAGSAERQYLGRLSQGFFGFHAFGVFGDVAVERIRQAKKTVWLIDSNSQIPALAISSESYELFRDCFNKLKNLNIRFFTTEKLFYETQEHFWYANNLVETRGETSIDIMLGAKGQPPYYQSNVFLEGFINWQEMGNVGGWRKYLHDVTGGYKYNPDKLREAINSLGFEIIPFDNWPGFNDCDYDDCSTILKKIVDAAVSTDDDNDSTNPQNQNDAEKKATPESEALLIIERERSGQYCMLSEQNEKSPAWFISRTGLLNTIEDGSHITWVPEAFLRFVQSLLPSDISTCENRSFEATLVSLAQSGVTFISDDTVNRVFSGLIDQSKLSIETEIEHYNELLEKKYGRSIETVLDELTTAEVPMALIQLNSESLALERDRRIQAEQKASDLSKRTKEAEENLAKIETFRRKYIAKQDKAKKQKRKNKGK